MKKHNKLEQWYVRYLIKSPLLFYGFLCFGIILFLGMALCIKPDKEHTLLWQIFVNVGKSL